MLKYLTKDVVLFLLMASCDPNVCKEMNMRVNIMIAGKQRRILLAILCQTNN